MNTFFLNIIMIWFIHRQAAGHFRNDIYATTPYIKLSEWYELDYNEKIDMIGLDHKITAFACLSNGYLTVIEGLDISQD